jgi:hypothetical protein
MDGFRLRRLVSIVGSAVWLAFILLYIEFWAPGFTLAQSVVILLTSLVTLAGVLGGAWAVWGPKGPPDSSTSSDQDFVPWPFKEGVTRATIAMITVCAFFGLLILPLVFLLAGKVSEAGATDLLKTLAAVVGGSVGIIVGFYFSETKQSTQGSNPSAFKVTFQETGLADQTEWSVNLHGNERSSNTKSIVFSEPNGTYNYTIGAVPGYTIDCSSSSVKVNGIAQSVPVKFEKIT